MKLEGNLMLVGIFIFSIIKFSIEFSGSNGGNLSVLSPFLWVGVGFFAMGIILWIRKFVRR